MSAADLGGLSAPRGEDRLAALAGLIRSEAQPPSRRPEYANNHIHTWYSFSPYSPSAAVYHARAAGLETAGIMDHDSLAGAEEFEKAGEIASVATTCGIECRVSLEGTPLQGRTVNNPDQDGIAYMSIHGIPRRGRGMVQDFFGPLRQKRNERNRAMVRRLNELTEPAGIRISFDQDVLPLSMDAEGGTVTERHLLFALAGKVLSRAEAAGSLCPWLEKNLGVQVRGRLQAALEDPSNPFRRYDLLGVLKAEFSGRIYLPANEELMHVSRLSRLARDSGGLLFYPYLGDVGVSVTGDKKPQRFEDSYLDLLFDTLPALGVDGVTYMPSRNTPEQLDRLQKKIREAGLMEISGEDINSPRQSFICPQLTQPAFRHLVAATWALIHRERGA